MDVYSLSVLVFIILLCLIVYRDRKNFRREFILLLRRTQKGREVLKKIAESHPGILKWMGNISVLIGFFASIWIFYQLLSITFENLLVPQPFPAAGLLLPSPSPEAQIGPGYFAVPFWYWIISIALLALVHEGFHGVMALREKVRIKSLGWGLLAVIPLAFVEPDENQLKRKPKIAQLRVFSAGSFANFCLAGVSFLMLSCLAYTCFQPIGVSFSGYPGIKLNQSDILTPVNLSGLDPQEIIALNTTHGILITRAGMLNLSKKQIELYEDYPAFRVNLTGVIIRIENFTIREPEDLKKALFEIGPGKEIEIETLNRTYRLVTAAEPEPEFRPNLNLFLLVVSEHLLPGISDYFLPEETWSQIKLKQKFWEWASGSPLLEGRATGKLEELQRKAENAKRSGFLGISGVVARIEVLTGLEPYKPILDFFQGLLFWLFLINLGVGAFNLLPIRGLDLSLIHI